MKPKGWPFSRDPVEVWESHGFVCALGHTPPYGGCGQFNGYVFIPSGHPDHGKTCLEVEDFIDVWGGLTYSNAGDDGTWFGWDDCHCDLCPRPAKAETESVARQFAERDNQ